MVTGSETAEHERPNGEADAALAEGGPTAPWKPAKRDLAL